MSAQYAIVTTHERPRRLSANLFSQLPVGTMIYTDDGTLGCTENHLRAWEDHAWTTEDVEWSVVLEDDAILCEDFVAQAEAMLSVAPGPVVSMYLGRGRPPQWQRKAERAVATNLPFIACTTLLHAVAVAVRTDWLSGPRGMLGPAADAARSPLRKPIDEAITEWCKAEAIPVLYSNPSIVDHDASLPSVAAHRPEEGAFQAQRVAHKFGARSERSPWYPLFAIM